MFCSHAHALFRESSRSLFLHTHRSDGQHGWSWVLTFDLNRECQTKIIELLVNWQYGQPKLIKRFCNEVSPNNKIFGYVESRLSSPMLNNFFQMINPYHRTYWRRDKTRGGRRSTPCTRCWMIWRPRFCCGERSFSLWIVRRVFLPPRGPGASAPPGFGWSSSWNI